MTPAEKKCRDMADVCELAHKRTVMQCKKEGIKLYKTHKKIDYTFDAQLFFDIHYDHICEVTGL